MTERLKYPLVITALCLVAAAGLALTYALTKDRIRQAERSELVQALEKVLPETKQSIQERPLAGVTSPHPADHEKLYIAVDADGKPVGYAAIGIEQGYSSRIHVMVGVTPDLHIRAVRILKQQETPGLGERTKEVPAEKSIWKAIRNALGGSGKCSPCGPRRAKSPAPEPPFQKQFRGKALGQLVLVKGPGSKDHISQITGATITSRAVVTAVRSAMETIQANLTER